MVQYRIQGDFVVESPGPEAKNIAKEFAYGQIYSVASVAHWRTNCIWFTS